MLKRKHLVYSGLLFQIAVHNTRNHIDYIIVIFERITFTALVRLKGLVQSPANLITTKITNRSKIS